LWNSLGRLLLDPITNYTKLKGIVKVFEDYAGGGSTAAAGEGEQVPAQEPGAIPSVTTGEGTLQPGNAAAVAAPAQEQAQPTNPMAMFAGSAPPPEGVTPAQQLAGSVPQFRDPGEIDRQAHETVIARIGPQPEKWGAGGLLSRDYTEWQEKYESGFKELTERLSAQDMERFRANVGIQTSQREYDLEIRKIQDTYNIQRQWITDTMRPGQAKIALAALAAGEHYVTLRTQEENTAKSLGILLASAEEPEAREELKARIARLEPGLQAGAKAAAITFKRGGDAQKATNAFNLSRADYYKSNNPNSPARRAAMADLSALGRHLGTIYKTTKKGGLLGSGQHTVDSVVEHLLTNDPNLYARLMESWDIAYPGTIRFDDTRALVKAYMSQFGSIPSEPGAPSPGEKRESPIDQVRRDMQSILELEVGGEILSTAPPG
jgi:hypothetical protein